jgi:hypothetical protein
MTPSLCTRAVANRRCLLQLLHAANAYVDGRWGQPPHSLSPTTSTLVTFVRTARNTVSYAEWDDAIARLVEEPRNTGLFVKKGFLARK